MLDKLHHCSYYEQIIQWLQYKVRKLNMFLPFKYFTLLITLTFCLPVYMGSSDINRTSFLKCRFPYKNKITLLVVREGIPITIITYHCCVYLIFVNSDHYE